MNKVIRNTIIAMSTIAMIAPFTSTNIFAHQIDYRNISGSDRFYTAVSISKNGWPIGAENVILVNSEAVADSLSVAPLASKIKAPVLLTKKNFLDIRTKNEIQRLGAKKIIIIGGEGSVSGNIEGELVSSGYSVERIFGNTRNETSIKIADKLKSISDSAFKNLFIVNGMKGLADAAGVGAIAAKNNSPIIFVNESGILETTKEVSKMNPEKIYLIGGKASLPSNFELISGNVKRISGVDRQETNLRMIEKFYPKHSTVYIADDGSNNSTRLIDSVLINAGIIASGNNFSNSSNILETKKDEENNDSGEATESVSQKDVKMVNSGLKEGPVMLVGEKKGLTYDQMRKLNSENNFLENIVQVSGGSNFTSQINNIKGFIENRANEESQKAFEKIMGYKYVVIEYNVGGKKTILDGNNILKMIVSNPSNNFTIDFNLDMIKSFVSSIDLSSVSTSGDAFAYRKNGNVIINRKGSGAKININEESKKLLDMLQSGKSYRGISPKYTKTEIPNGATALGDTYVQISLRNQNMRVWKNGKSIINTPIVSGNPNRGSATPPGIFKINKKMKNVVLRGPGYASPVKYWLPFNGSIGIHDSYWQPVYGGRRYLSHGSHGCINTPLNAVGNLYNNIRVGTPVVVQ